jgi:hypothetical protein
MNYNICLPGNFKQSPKDCNSVKTEPLVSQIQARLRQRHMSNRKKQLFLDVGANLTLRKEIHCKFRIFFFPLRVRNVVLC